MWPLLLRKIFDPNRVPNKFKAFPTEMAVRPSQLRAAAAESALMIPAANTLRDAYRQLEIPVLIVAGAKDRYIESEQSSRLHREIPHSTFYCIPRTGHMVHQTKTAEIMAAIDAAAQQRKSPALSPRAT
jgi:pimeloyl-ACP methyl ester carboxylesterase